MIIVMYYELMFIIIPIFASKFKQHVTPEKQQKGHHTASNGRLQAFRSTGFGP